MNQSLQKHISLNKIPPLIIYCLLLITLSGINNRVNAAGRQPSSTSVIVDGSTDVGAYASLAIVNGNPAIAYFDRFYLRLKYVRANDMDGTSWGTPVVAVNTQYTGLYNSLAVINGNPAIAFYNSFSKSLNYVRANDADGLTWTVPITIDQTGKVGLYASLAVINGNPAIAYQDQTDANHALLKYVRASNANGSMWGLPETIDNTGNPGWGISLQQINGYPAIAYYNIGGTASLRYVLASNIDGTAWGNPQTIDSPIIGTLPSLLLVDGFPAVAYGDASSSANGHLKYIRAADPTGTSWRTPLNVDITGNVGYFPSLAVISGVPAIAYTDNTTHNLIYVQSSDPDGTRWIKPFIIDSGQFDAFSSLANVNGKPGIAYEDYSGTGNLRFIIPDLPRYSLLFLPILVR